MKRRNEVDAAISGIESPAAESNGIIIELPIGGGEQPGYQGQLIDGGDVSLDMPGKHIDLQIGSRAAKAFVRVRNGLRQKHATLPGGRPVWSNADAVRYIFEAIADAAESNTENTDNTIL